MRWLAALLLAALPTTAIARNAHLEGPDRRGAELIFGFGSGYAGKRAEIYRPQRAVFASSISPDRGRIDATDLHAFGTVLGVPLEQLLGGRPFARIQFHQAAGGGGETLSGPSSGVNIIDGVFVGETERVRVEYRYEVAGSVGVEHQLRLGSRRVRIRPAVGVGVARVAETEPVRKSFWLTSLLGALEIALPLRTSERGSFELVLGGQVEYAVAGEDRSIGLKDIERVPVPRPPPRLRFDDLNYRGYVGLEVRHSLFQ